jgi:hypothetical protein
MEIDWKWLATYYKAKALQLMRSTSWVKAAWWFFTLWARLPDPSHPRPPHDLPPDLSIELSRPNLPPLTQVMSTLAVPQNPPISSAIVWKIPLAWLTCCVLLIVIKMCLIVIIYRRGAWWGGTPIADMPHLLQGAWVYEEGHTSH